METTEEQNIQNALGKQRVEMIKLIEGIPSRIIIGKIGNVYVNGKKLNEKDKLATKKDISLDLISRKELLKKFQGEELTK